LAPEHLRTGADLYRHLGVARRVLDGGAPTDPSPAAACRPYDALLVGRLRLAARRLGRLPGLGGPARAVAAAFEAVRRLGWPCRLEIARSGQEAGATLRLWGAPVLTSGEDLGPPDRVVISGPEVPATAPHLPPVSDPTVARVTVAGPPGPALGDLLGQLGGVAGLIPPGSRVLLKANFNSYHAPPASTGFDLLDAVVAELRAAGTAHVAIGECSAIALGRTREVVERAGLAQWARRSEVELICFDEQPWRTCTVGGRHFRQIVVPACLPDFDRLIYLVAAKTHHLAGVSLGLKMTIGLMHPAQRIELHRDHLTERVADAALAVRPHLVIADARRCFVTGGPAEGTVAAPGVMLASRDLLAIEAAGLDLLTEHGAAGVDRGREQLSAAGRKFLQGDEGIPWRTAN
jgi:uncharacterized protein (DUF362 family)